MNTLVLAAVLLFPTVHGKSVMQHQTELPRDLKGTANFVLVTFNQDQQILADSWLPVVREIQKEQSGVEFREVCASDLNDRWTRGTVDAYYNFETSDPATHENTVVLCGSRCKFARALHLPNDHTVYALLLDSSGYVRWRAAGMMTPMSGEQLKEAVAELLAKS